MQPLNQRKTMKKSRPLLTERSASGYFASVSEVYCFATHQGSLYQHEVLLTAAFILWPRCTCGFGIREKIRCGLRFFGRISVRFCGFRTPPPPPYAPLYQGLPATYVADRNGYQSKEKGVFQFLPTTSDMSQ